MIGTYRNNSLTFPIQFPGSYCEGFSNSKGKSFWTDYSQMNEVSFLTKRGWNRKESKSSDSGLVVNISSGLFEYENLQWSVITEVKTKDHLELYLIPENVDLVYTDMYWYKDLLGNNMQTAKFGIDYACYKQVFNRLPGLSAMSRVDFLAVYLNDYKKRYLELGLEKCYDQIIPDRLLLKDPKQCQIFLDIAENIASDQTKAHSDWIVRDLMRNKGYGVEIVDYGFAKYFYGVYTSSEVSCSSLLPTHNSLIIERFINSALIEERRFKFQVFVMIVNADPLIAVWAPRNSQTHLSEQTAYTKQKDLQNTATLSHDYDIIKEYKLNLRELAYYFTDKHDPETWLNEIAYPKLKKSLIHLIRAAQQNFLIKRAGLFEVFGVDFLLDENLKNFYLIGCKRKLDFRDASELQYRMDEVVEDIVQVIDFFIINDFKISGLAALYKSFQAFEPLIDETDYDPYFSMLPKECGIKFKDMNWELPIDPMIEPLKFYTENFF